MGPAKEFVTTNIHKTEELKDQIFTNENEEAKNDLNRDLAFEKFKKDRDVTQNYFIV